jgi:hypothetical protein
MIQFQDFQKPTENRPLKRKKSMASSEDSLAFAAASSACDGATGKEYD